MFYLRNNANYICKLRMYWDRFSVFHRENCKPFAMDDNVLQIGNRKVIPGGGYSRNMVNGGARL